MRNLLIEATAALILLVPIFLLLNVLLLHNSRRTWRYALFALYLAAVYHVVGLPTVTFLTFDAAINLIPILPMKEDLKNTILNTILFIPLGFFLPYLWNRFRHISETLLLGFCATLTIELGQLLTYRVTDINDIITNFLGCLTGYVLFCFSFLLKGKKMPAAGRSIDLWLVLGTVFAVMFFLHPPVAALFYKLT